MTQAMNGLSPMVQPYKDAIEANRQKEEAKKQEKEKEKEKSLDLKKNNEVVKAMEILTTAINGNSTATNTLSNKLNNNSENLVIFQ